MFKFHLPAFALGARQGFFTEAVEALESSRAVLLCSADCVGQHLIARKLVIFLVVNIPNSVGNFGGFYPLFILATSFLIALMCELLKQRSPRKSQVPSVCNMANVAVGWN